MTHSLDIREVSNTNLARYYGIAIPAMTLNVAVLGYGLLVILKEKYIQGIW